MGWRIVKQPNGLLARFSDVVDDFTHYDMTVEEAVELCRAEMGLRDAVEKVERGLRDEPIPPFIEASGRGDGLDRFRAAITTIRTIHGARKAKQRERQLSAGAGESEATS